MSIHLRTRTIRGQVYGVGPCTLEVGTERVAAVAVRAGGESHVTSREGAFAWLANHGLSLREAREFVRRALRQAAAHGDDNRLTIR